MRGTKNKKMTKTTIQSKRQRRTVFVVRHGEKNTSTAAVNPNQLTDQGKREALEYGNCLNFYDKRKITL